MKKKRKGTKQQGERDKHMDRGCWAGQQRRRKRSGEASRVGTGAGATAGSYLYGGVPAAPFAAISSTP